MELQSNPIPLHLFKIILNKKKLITLSTLPINQFAYFVSCQASDLNARLADVGMMPGTIWKVIQKIPFAGPLVLSNGNIHISLRAEDAGKIIMQPN